MSDTSIGLVDLAHAANDAHYSAKPLSKAKRLAHAKAIAARQGLPNSYGGTFTGIGDEVECIRSYTGERFASASARHILGEECIRALRLLDVDHKGVRAAMARAEAGMVDRLNRAEADPRNTNPGLFCCGKCTCAMWRALLSGALDRHDERLTKGIGHMKQMRKDDGKWHHFTF